jgi:hypothetical protein
MSLTKEQTVKRKDMVKNRIKKKVPKLNQITDNFIEELEDPRYLDITSDLDEMLLQIDRNE